MSTYKPWDELAVERGGLLAARTGSSGLGMDVLLLYHVTSASWGFLVDRKQREARAANQRAFCTQSARKHRRGCGSDHLLPRALLKDSSGRTCAYWSFLYILEAGDEQLIDCGLLY